MTTSINFSPSRKRPYPENQENDVPNIPALEETEKPLSSMEISSPSENEPKKMVIGDPSATLPLLLRQPSCIPMQLRNREHYLLQPCLGSWVEDRYKFLTGIFVKHFDANAYDEALATLDQLERLVEDRTFPVDLVDINLYRALCHFKSQNFKNYRKCCHRALAVRERLFLHPQIDLFSKKLIEHDTLLKNVIKFVQQQIASSNLDETLLEDLYISIYEMQTELEQFLEAQQTSILIQRYLPLDGTLYAAHCLLNLSAFKEAIALYQQVLNNSLLNHPALALSAAKSLFRGYSQFHLEELVDLALDYIDCIKEAPQLKPETLIEVLKLEFDCNYTTDRFDSALAVLLHLHQCDPGELNFILDQATCHIFLMQNDHAVSCLNKALQFKEELSSAICPKFLKEFCIPWLKKNNHLELASKYETWVSEISA